jgi:orotidine-5'-phosphate decarboxylase
MAPRPPPVGPERAGATLIGTGGDASCMQFNRHLVLALDDVEPSAAVAIARALQHGLDAVKVGWPLVLSAGTGVVGSLADIVPVICDFKVADIPAVNEMIVSAAVGAGSSGVIVHGFVGSDSVAAAVKAAKGMDVFVVAEMSHPGAVEFIQPAAEAIARMAKDAGAAGIIAPATRPERVAHLREVIGPDMRILSPGVGTQGGDARRAVQSGADALIVGRSLYWARDPQRAMAELQRSLLGP